MSTFTKKIRSYTELSKLTTFHDRYEYLRLDGLVGDATFGYDRYLNQGFYRSREWKKIRDAVIMRDLGCDLGIEGYEIHVRPIIHHMNPITLDDIQNMTDNLIDPEFLITTVHITHNAIHYGDSSLLITEPIERKPFDTCPWKGSLQ